MEQAPGNLTEVTRRDIVDALIVRGGACYSGRLEVTDFLARVFDLDDMRSTDGRFATARGDIWQHMVRNNDWEDHYLLVTYLGLLRVPDSVFLEFLCQTLHPVVRQDPDEVGELAAMYNDLLRHDGYELVPAKTMSDRPVFEARNIRAQALGAAPVSAVSGPYKYDVALSFAGEQRVYVEQVARQLAEGNVSLFYDGNEQASLWGKRLEEHLRSIYEQKARYCVMFVSRDYRDKAWPTKERTAAMARSLCQYSEYILPVRIDQTEIEGITDGSIAYVNASQYTPPKLAALIVEKLESSTTD